MRLDTVVSRLLAVNPVTEPTDPVRLPVNVVVSAVVTVVAALVPAMKCPPAAPGTTPPMNKSLPMLPATVKSPAVVSLQITVAIDDVVSQLSVKKKRLTVIAPDAANCHATEVPLVSAARLVLT